MNTPLLLPIMELETLSDVWLWMTGDEEFDHGTQP